MATHSSILAWKIPWTEEPGRLQPRGCTVGHNLVTKQFVSPLDADGLLEASAWYPPGSGSWALSLY